MALAAAVLRPVTGAGAAVPGGAYAVRLDAIALPVFALAAAVAAALLLQLLFDVVRLRRIKRRAWPVGTVPVRGARIGLSQTVTTPTAIGYLHPAVVVPADFRNRVDDGEWNAVIAHEVAHLARRDDWAKALQSGILRACWWLPGLWLLASALDLERELASDERAAGETGPRRYAACLLRLATDRGSGLAPAFGGRRAQVAIRVERLLRPPMHATPVARATALGALTAATLAALAFAVIAVPSTGHLVAPRGLHVLQLALAPPRLAASHPAPRPALHRVQFAPARPASAAVAPAVPAGHVPAAQTTRPGAPKPATEAALATPVTTPAPAAGNPRHRNPRVTEIASAAIHALPVVAPAGAPAVAPAQAVRTGLAGVAGTPEGSIGAPEFLAFARPHSQCPTCFGPLRSPDSANPGVPATPPSRFEVAPSAMAAIVADDTSGATDLRLRVFLIRIPHAASAP